MTAPGAPPSPLRHRIDALLAHDDRPTPERERLAELMALLAGLPPPPDLLGLLGDYERLHQRFVASLEGDDPERLEERFNELYCHLHGYDAPYTPEERACVRATGGYWCHAGGLSPIVKAGPWIGPHTVSADYGAGNGLQGLLLQRLYPHRLTVQIEVSSRLVAAGRELQRWLDIPPERVVWRIDDVRRVPPDGMDFIYLYRPLKPVGVGAEFYRAFAARLAQSEQEVVIFSVADCLKDFLGADFERFYDDGHLCCFRRRPRSTGTRSG